MHEDEINGQKMDGIASELNESAIVSFVLGVALFMMAPLTLNFNVNLWSEGPLAGPTSIPMNLAYPAGIIGLILTMLIALASIIFGIRGLFFAAKRKSSKVMALAGTIVSLVAFLLWIIVAVDLVAILSCFRHVNY